MAKITAWRIFKPKYRATAFDGEGARRVGGRFSSRGRPIVYTSATLSLAMLEVLVGAEDVDLLRHYLCAPATFDRPLVHEIETDELPDGWNARPHSAVSQAIGDGWLASGRSAILRVPSVVVPEEYNYLLNPEHADFAKIQIGTARPALFDSRLLSRLTL